MLRAWLGVEWLRRKLEYVESMALTARRDLTDLVGRVQELEEGLQELRDLGGLGPQSPPSTSGAALKAHDGLPVERLLQPSFAVEQRTAAGYAERASAYVDGRDASPIPSAARAVSGGAGALPFDLDVECPHGQLHELGGGRWAAHPRTLEDIAAGRLESVTVHRYAADNPIARRSLLDLVLAPNNREAALYTVPGKAYRMAKHGAGLEPLRAALGKRQNHRTADRCIVLSEPERDEYLLVFEGFRDDYLEDELPRDGEAFLDACKSVIDGDPAGYVKLAELDRSVPAPPTCAAPDCVGWCPSCDGKEDVYG